MYPGGRFAMGGAFLIAVIDEEGLASCAVGGVNIAPAVADKITGQQIQPVLGGGLVKQPGSWFPASAAIAIDVITDEDVIQRQVGPQPGMHSLDYSARLRPLAYVRLIGDGQEEKACGFEVVESSGHPGQDLQFLDRGRRKRPAITDGGSVEDAVAVEEDGRRGHSGQAS
jgi:hypothetical protein